MKYKELSEKQLELIKLLVKGEKPITDCLKEVQIAKSTYYDWRKNNHVFNKAIDEAVENNVNALKQNVRSNAKKYIKLLEDIAANGKNENARTNALGKLINLGELDPSFKQEVTVKNEETTEKNKLKAMLQRKQDEEESSEEQIH